MWVRQTAFLRAFFDSTGMLSSSHPYLLLGLRSQLVNKPPARRPKSNESYYNEVEERVMQEVEK